MILYCLRNQVLCIRAHNMSSPWHFGQFHASCYDISSVELILPYRVSIAKVQKRRPSSGEWWGDAKLRSESLTERSSFHRPLPPDMKNHPSTCATTSPHKLFHRQWRADTAEHAYSNYENRCHGKKLLQFTGHLAYLVRKCSDWEHPGTLMDILRSVQVTAQSVRVECWTSPIRSASIRMLVLGFQKLPRAKDMRKPKVITKHTRMVTFTWCRIL